MIHYPPSLFRFLAALIIAFGFWAGCLRAEDTKLNSLPSSEAQWKVEIYTPPLSEEEKQAKNLRSPSSIEENASAPGIRKEKKRIAQAQQPIERYAQKGWILYFEPQTGAPVVEPNSPEAWGGSLSAKAWDELAWVKPELKQGQTTYRGIPCNVYTTTWPLTFALQQEPADNEKPAPATQATVEPKQITAYLAADTGLPVALESPIETRWYTFVTPTGTLALPTKLSDTLQDTLAAIEFRQKRYNIPQ